MKIFKKIKKFLKHNCKNNLIFITEEDRTFYFLNIVAYCPVCGKKYILSNTPKEDYSKYDSNKNYEKIIENSLIEVK